MSALIERASTYREAWCFPAFRTLLFGQGLSMAGDAVCLAALPVATMHAGRSGETFGAIMAAVGIGSVIGAAAGGVLADRRSPQRILFATDTARGAAQITSAALIAGSAPWCLAASGLGACIGTFVAVLAAGQRHLTAMALGCGLCLGAAMAALGAAQAAWLAVLGAGLAGIVEASWLTGWATAIQVHAPARDLGKVVAVDTILTNGMHPYVYLGGGLAGATFGYAQTMTLTAALSIIGTGVIALIALWRGAGGSRP